MFEKWRAERRKKSLTKRYASNVANLQDSDKRSKAAAELLELGDTRCVGDLIDVLRDPESSGYGCGGIAHALIKLGPSEGIEPLIDALQLEKFRSVTSVGCMDSDAEEIVRALGSAKEPKAVEPLIDLFKNESLNVKLGMSYKKFPGAEAIVDSLGEIGDERAIPLLTDLLLEKRLGSVEEFTSNLMSELKKNLISAQVDIAPDDSLMELTRDGVQCAYQGLRVCAARALGNMMTSPDAVDALENAKNDKEQSVRDAVIESLSNR